jgi:predicted nucleic acid-binding protein
MNAETIVDTSVWIDFFRGEKTILTKKLLLLMDTNDIIVPPIIIQEVLQGVIDKKIVDVIENLFFGFKFIGYDEYEAAFEAASLYRFLRKKGVTIRSSNDALIAWICKKYNFQLLHNDRDFTNIAKHLSLKIYK